MSETRLLTQTEYIQRIDEADVSPVAMVSPLEHAERLSQTLGNTLWLKREDLQPVFSFKLRGAYHRIAALTASERERGVVCSSAGNHAQGVALAASRFGTSARIVMPITTPSIKVNAVRELGGEVELAGENFDDAQAHALNVAAAEQRILIHPFDDPRVIVGQGTVARELTQQHTTPPAAVFVPIGGGGLIAGVATYLKHHWPATKIIGVEHEDSASMTAALAAGQPVALERVGTFADGVAVKTVGNETFRLCQSYVDDIVQVDTDETCAAIQELFEQTRSIAEPAGALALAGAKRYAAANNLSDEDLVVLVCGANMNFDRLRHVVERASIGKHTEALLAVRIPEEAGSFERFCEALGPVSVTEFNYRFQNRRNAHIFVGIALGNGFSERAALVTHLETAGYQVTDLSDNELAKLHIRHTVGGAPANLLDERLLRFRFPERSGALLYFLRAIGLRWNISLFHYRNHGSDYGRVLAGIQVPENDSDEFGRHLDTLGYAYWDETDNPAFRLFLESEKDDQTL